MISIDTNTDLLLAPVYQLEKKRQNANVKWNDDIIGYDPRRMACIHSVIESK